MTQPLTETRVTDRDRTRWELRAARELVRILERAFAADLPPLTWQVTGLGLTGTVPPGYGRRSEYGEFLLWVDHLEMVLGEERRLNGRRHLRATVVRDSPRGGSRVTVTVVAKIDEAGQ